MLGDPNREASRANEVLLPDPVAGVRDVADRAVFVIDRGGTCRYAWLAEIRGQPASDAVLAAVL